jgi:sugar lactone lactonase YvrE
LSPRSDLPQAPRESDVSVETVFDGRALIAECPLWDPALGLLWWVDIPRGQVHRLDPKTGEDRVLELGDDVGAVVPRGCGGVIAARRSGFSSIDVDGAVETVVDVDLGDARLRFNDARCDPRGRLWVGTVRDDFAPGVARLYCLTGDGHIERRLDGVTISNGLDWSLDGQTLYYADSGPGTVDAFEYDLEHGVLGNRRPFARIEPEDGFPDGLCVDAEGFVWIAVYGSWAVRRYSPDGRLDQVIEFPARDLTSVGFGGEALDVMFVTSASERVEVGQWADQPQAGGIFSCRPGQCGRPQHGWAG